MSLLKSAMMSLIFISLQIQADEHAGASIEAANGVKKNASEQDYSGAQTEEWSKIQKDVQIAKIKYDNDQKNLEELKAANQHGESMSTASWAAINEAAKKVKDSEQNYLRILNQYKHRFPEKGLNIGRKYEHAESDSEGNSESFVQGVSEGVQEKSQNLEGKLRRLNKNIRKQYAVSSTAVSAQKKKPIKSDIKQAPRPTQQDVTDKIILEK